MNTFGFATTSCLLALALLEAIRLDTLRLCSTARADGRRLQSVASASLALEEESGSLDHATWPRPTWLRKRTAAFSRSIRNTHHAFLR